MITKEVLKELYLKQNKTREQIAKELNVPESQVNFYCWKYQIRKDIKAHLFEKICPICNKHFIVATADRDRIYCSTHCMRIGSRKVPRKVCPNCGKEFVNYSRKKCYCSKKCRREYEYKQSFIIYKRVCQHCGKEYDYYDAMPNWFAKGYVKGKKYYGVDSSKYCCYDCGIAHRQEVSRKTCLNKYGVEFTAASENNLSKSRQTKLKRYGNSYYTNVLKGLATKKKKHTFSVSKPENEINKLLTKKFPNVIRQYRSKKYPFNCDFYIPELNLYIEYQGFWNHGGHPFNNQSEQDTKKLEIWKSRMTKHPAYLSAIEVWTKRDPLKRKVAKENNLNWLEFFTMKEFENWFKNLQ